MLPFLSSFDLLVAASVVSAAAGLGSALFLLARHQQSAAIPAPEVAVEAAEAAQPAAA